MRFESSCRLMENVTRFEVIDHRTGGEGRILVALDVQVQLDYQDDRTTLKVFLNDPPAEKPADDARAA